jgi:hypothetical protein
MVSNLDYSACGIFDQRDIRVMAIAAQLARRGNRYDLTERDIFTRLQIIRLYSCGLRHPRVIAKVASQLAAVQLSGSLAADHSLMTRDLPSIPE